jgi:polysaccharide export outer membrane protein
MGKKGIQDYGPMRGIIAAMIVLTAGISAGGCRLPPAHHADAGFPLPPPEMPRELSKVVLPTYVIEPPDILIIEAIHIRPRAGYALRTGDVVAINVLGTLPDAPITGAYPIQPGGIVNLGIPYGSVKISGMTVEQAQEEIRRVLAMQIREPVVTASLVEMAGKQQIAGQHLVGPDGTVTLGSYGSVPVVGLTLAQAKIAIESYLRQFLEDPEVSVDVFAYNSKVYYIITEGAGLGDGVTRFPITGNETVLDAIANVNGLTQASSKKIWIARPVPHTHEMHILPVDWQAITAHGAAITNYQILPGDRVFVAEDRLVAFDTSLAKLLAPFERGMGFVLLGTGTVTRLSGKVLRGGGVQGTGGGFIGGGF